MQLFAATSFKTGLAAVTLGVLALGMCAAPAHAQNLVQDGDFEQADPNSGPYDASQSFDSFWNVGSGLVSIDSVSNGMGAFVYDGQQSLFLTAGPGVSEIDQTLATTAGQKYTISFAADSDDPNNFFEVLFGSTLPDNSPFIIPANGFPSGDDLGNAGQFTTYSLTATATSSSTLLRFFGQAASGTLGTELDDVSVTPVPEASQAASFGLLLALGMGGLVIAAKRRKTTVKTTGKTNA